MTPNPSAKCRRRISAQFSTESTSSPPEATDTVALRLVSKSLSVVDSKRGGVKIRPSFRGQFCSVADRATDEHSQRGAA
ncbi:MAG: hypothetical protein ACRDTZ_05535, partial [Pseudonocardiaceae bacterium]